MQKRAIICEIDTTENGYERLEGDAASVGELKALLIRNDAMPDLVGTLSADDMPEVSIWIAAEKELGMFISITDGDNISLTLSDETALSETVDVWGDDLCISKGLFIPVSAAWNALETYFASGSLSGEIRWTTPETISEDGNFLC